MCAKGDVITINIRMHIHEHCHSRNSDEILDSYDEDIPSNDENVEHGYYDGDKELDIKYENTMRGALVLW